MKRIRAEVEITRCTYVEFEVDDDLDDQTIKSMAIEEAELGEWQDDLPEVVSFEIVNVHVVTERHPCQAAAMPLIISAYGQSAPLTTRHMGAHPTRGTSLDSRPGGSRGSAGGDGPGVAGAGPAKLADVLAPAVE